MPCVFGLFQSRSVPRHWKSSDHQAIVWCRRLQLSLSRALFNLQYNNSYNLDTTKHRHVFDYWLSSPSLRDKISIKKLPAVVASSKWAWSVQYNQNMFFNLMENQVIMVITYQLLSVTGCLWYQFIVFLIGEWIQRD